MRKVILRLINRAKNGHSCDLQAERFEEGIEVLRLMSREVGGTRSRCSLRSFPKR